MQKHYLNREILNATISTTNDRCNRVVLNAFCFYISDKLGNKFIQKRLKMLKKFKLITVLIISTFLVFSNPAISNATTIDWYDRDINVINTFLDSNPDLYYAVYYENNGYKGVALVASTCDSVSWYQNITAYFNPEGCPTGTTTYRYNFEDRANGFTTPQIYTGTQYLVTQGSNLQNNYSIIAENFSSLDHLTINSANSCPACEVCQTCPPVEPPTDLDKINTSILLVPASLFAILFFYNIFIMYRYIKR